jgi:hypothetical protein
MPTLLERFLLPWWPFGSGPEGDTEVQFPQVTGPAHVHRCDYHQGSESPLEPLGARDRPAQRPAGLPSR